MPPPCGPCRVRFVGGRLDGAIQDWAHAPFPTIVIPRLGGRGFSDGNFDLDTLKPGDDLYCFERGHQDDLGLVMVYTHESLTKEQRKRA